LAYGSYRIVIEKTINEFRVVRNYRGRNGTLFELGQRYDQEGLASSGLFLDGELLHSLEVQN
jgi:hypothetical protein